MTTNRKLTIGIIALLIINVVIVGVLMTGHKRNKSAKNDRRQGAEHIIIEKLNFDDTQIASLRTLKMAHIKNVRSKDEEIREVKKLIFNSLGSDSPVNIDSLSTIIGGIQKDIELSHYYHFIKIKELCREDQIGHFIELSKELSEIFKPKNRSSRMRK
jgi:hypothetical protein